jgi:ABC-type transport system involved in multi-copper enzyme maturation permease subunit
VTQPSAYRRPSVLFSTARIFDLSLGQMLWSRRSVFLGLLVGAPVVLALAVRLVFAFSTVVVNGNRARVPGDAVFGVMMWLLYVRFIVPVLGVFYGTAFIADEVDDKTITYLFTRPISRRAVLFGKYLAYLVCSALLVLPSAMLVFFLIVPTGGASIAQAFPALLSDLGMLAIGLAAYGAVFAFVGTRVRRPLLIGLLFALGWEPTVLVVPGYLKRLSVAYYLQALVVHDVPQDSGPLVILQAFRESPPLAVALMALAIIIVAALWLAGRAVERREYVLEQ